MNENIIKNIANDLNIRVSQVESVLKLLQEDCTIPFIARYRKEATGNLDEEQIREISKVYEYEVNLLQRKEDVIRLIDEKGMLTDELRQEIMNSTKLVEVEDLYRPYKEKKKTKATEAIKKGLQPLADFIMLFGNNDVEEEAKKYITEEVKSVDEAITGAKYIIAEMVSDVAEYRKDLREMLYELGTINTKVKKDAEDPKKVYEIYYEYSEPISKIKPHRVLAVNRAEKEKVITVNLDIEMERMINYLNKKVIIKNNVTEEIYVKDAISDSLKRLIFPSIEREVRSELTEVAENQAITIFSLNLEKLLLQPPLRGKVILGVDPGFRTGCKLAVVNPEGTLREIDVIMPHLFGEEKREEARLKVIRLCNAHKVELIAIGNGTASRETEEFIAETIKKGNLSAKYVIVSEAGASVYSASNLAIKEFPDLTVEKRSAVSIARRLQDPLSELVKIDPKSIGVGQYQHDVTPKKLNEQLTFVVTQAVNQVGVDVNTASVSLLSYVSGLSTKVAESIVETRNKNGRFNSREEISKIKSMGPKTFEQAAGFLRISDGYEVLDMTPIHPESYETARLVMDKFNITKDQIGKAELKKLFNSVDSEKLAKELNSDKYTVSQILESLIQPIRDPRDEFPQPILKSGILQIEDLRIGMELEGTVRNVVDFGAFVDLGLHEDALLHISKISKSYIKHPSDVLSVGDIIKVYVIDIKADKGKVAVSLIKDFIPESK